MTQSIVLISPWAKDLGRGRWLDRVFPHPAPLGLVSIGTVLQEAGFEVSVVDQRAQDLSVSSLVEAVRRRNPLCVGLSVLAGTMKVCEGIIRELRRALPSSSIVLGNTHASYFADELIREGLADVVVHGEGEETMRDVAIAIHESRSLAGIRGITYRDGAEPRRNPDRPPVGDLDSLPRPDWRLLDLRLPAYRQFAPMGTREVILPIQASRGCPYRCVFCAHNPGHPRLRTRSPTSIVQEMERNAIEFGVRRFLFVDAYFPWSRRCGERFAEELDRLGLSGQFDWYTEMRVDRVDEGLMRRLKGVGLKQIFLGFESGNSQVLARTGKRITLAQSLQAREAARKAGVRVYGFFLLGLPGDTRETCEQTIAFAHVLDPELLQFSLVVPYPGSALYEALPPSDRPRDRNAWSYSPWDEERPPGAPPIHVPTGLTRRTLLEMQSRAMARFYARPGKVLRLLFCGILRPSAIWAGGTLLARRLMQDFLSPRDSSSG